MITINLTPQESNNLLAFLSRVQLNGAEATLFVQIQQKIQLAQVQAATLQKENTLNKEEVTQRSTLK